MDAKVNERISESSKTKCIITKERRQNSLPLTTKLSQNVTEPSKGISYSVGDLCQRFTKLTGLSAYTLHSNLIPQQMVQMAFCDLSHTIHKRVTNVSQHVFVILLWGIRDFPYHATFREKGAKLACADKLGVFLSLTLCKKATFEYLSFIK